MHSESAARVAFDAVAVKPLECDVADAADLPVPRVIVDYEGHDAFPDRGVLETLAARKDVRVTTPVRADGFDPFGDDSLARALPAEIGRVLVAGNPAYLTAAERKRAVSTRLGEAVETYPDAWVGTEGIERIALATGAPQFELLSRTTARDVRALRAAGFEGEIAVYAPTVLTDDEDAVLDAVGPYTSRRGAVKRALPDDARTDGGSSGRARDVLSKAVHDYALVGTTETVRERVDALRDAGVDHVVAYPARGLDDLK